MTTATPDLRAILVHPNIWNGVVDFLAKQDISLGEVHSDGPVKTYVMREVRVTVGANSGLTAREMQVLQGMSKGMTNGEIGRGLYLSEDTVKTHARRLFRKLGARDRAHAVAIAFTRGILNGGAR